MEEEEEEEDGCHFNGLCTAAEAAENSAAADVGTSYVASVQLDDERNQKAHTITRNVLITRL